jgi:hypothetical protein
MAGNVVDKASIDISGDILWADSVDIAPEDDTDFVTAMTDDNSPLGIKRGNERFTVTAEVTMTVDDDTVEAAWEDKRNVPVVVYFENGVTHSFAYGAIAKVDLAAKSGESVKRTIEIKAWGRARS